LIFFDLGLRTAKARSASFYLLSLGLKALGLGKTLYLFGKIVESRREGVRHNIKCVIQYVRQIKLRHSNISPNN
jgi:hypothetical protein